MSTLAQFLLHHRDGRVIGIRWLVLVHIYTYTAVYPDVRGDASVSDVKAEPEEVAVRHEEGTAYNHRDKDNHPRR